VLCEVFAYEAGICCRRCGSWLKDTFHHTSRYTTLCWISAVALLLNSLALFLAYLASSDPRYLLLSIHKYVSDECNSFFLLCGKVLGLEIEKMICCVLFWLTKLAEIRSCYSLLHSINCFIFYGTRLFIGKVGHYTTKCISEY